MLVERLDELTASIAAAKRTTSAPNADIGRFTIEFLRAGSPMTLKLKLSKSKG